MIQVFRKLAWWLRYWLVAMNIPNTVFHSPMVSDNAKSYVFAPGFALLQQFGEGASAACPTQSFCTTHDQLPESNFSACQIE